MNASEANLVQSDIHRIAWSWERPLLEHAVDFLCQDAEKSLTLDLSTKLILLPTSEAARRLREALALRMSDHQGVVLAPHIFTAESALRLDIDEQGTASAIEELFAWRHTLSTTDLSQFEVLFPVLPEPAGLPKWRAQTANALSQMKNLLAAGGYEVGDLLESMTDTPDIDRWRDLAKLEEAFNETLRSLEVQHAVVSKKQSAQAPKLPEGVDEVILMGLFEVTPLFRTWLSQVAQTYRVTSCVYTSPDHAHRFDGFGIPLIESWSEGETPEVELQDSQYQIAKDPKAQAELALNWAMQKADHCGEELSLAFATTDAELNPFLESHLLAHELLPFDPSGKHASHHSMMKNLSLWSEFLKQGYWNDFKVWMRHPDALAALRHALDSSESALLKALDETTTDFLPTTLDRLAPLLATDSLMGRVLEKVQQWKLAWNGVSMRAAIQDYLHHLYGKRTFLTQRPYEKQYMNLTSAVIDVAEEMDECYDKLESQATLASLLDVLLHEVGKTALDEHRGEVDFNIYGWLDLVWEPAKHLVILGMNEEYLPGVVKGDIFLPDTVKSRLGLTHQRSKRARDTYLLHAILGQRQSDGDVLLLLGRENAEGEGLKPTRLFFDTSDEALVNRVHKLFPKDLDDAEAAEPASTLGFKLTPPYVEKDLTQISASQMKLYLRCPFRYYLSRYLGMESVDTSAEELDAPTFGNLIHQVLTEYAVKPEFQRVVEAEVVADWLVQRVDELWKAKYGEEALATILLQLESAKQRLLNAAEALCELRLQGWETESTEEKVANWNIEIDGIKIAGAIDRIDRRVVNGVTEYRIIDYKTGRSRSPQEAHLEKLGKNEEVEEEAAWNILGGSSRWVDLQLPLYAYCLQQKYPEANISVAYFNLPPTVADLGLIAWDDFDLSILEAAKTCATEILSRIKAKQFWPPNTEVGYEDFAFLLDDPLQTIDPTQLLAAISAQH